jgi:hypothetical protein
LLFTNGGPTPTPLAAEPLSMLTSIARSLDHLQIAVILSTYQLLVKALRNH